MRRGVEPTDQPRVLGERSGFTRQLRENGLCHILGTMSIAIGLAQRGTIDEIEVAPFQFNERFLRTICGIATEQFGVICLIHHVYRISCPPLAKPNKESRLGRSPSLDSRPNIGIYWTARSRILRMPHRAG